MKLDQICELTIPLVLTNKNVNKLKKKPKKLKKSVYGVGVMPYMLGAGVGGAVDVGGDGGSGGGDGGGGGGGD